MYIKTCNAPVSGQRSARTTRCDVEYQNHKPALYVAGRIPTATMNLCAERTRKENIKGSLPSARHRATVCGRCLLGPLCRSCLLSGWTIHQQREFSFALAASQRRESVKLQHFSCPAAVVAITLQVCIPLCYHPAPCVTPPPTLFGLRCGNAVAALH